MTQTSLTRRQALRIAALGATGGAAAMIGHAQDASPAADFITSETQAAIDRGLAFLHRTQSADGSFTDSGIPNAAITGLAALALMAGGHHPGRGQYGRTVSRAMDYLVARAASNSPAGYLNSGEGGFGQGGGMYQHGFATLFLAELYGMLPTAARQLRLREALEKAIRLIIDSQNKLGGWRYDPRPSESDVSVTVAQLMALRAARNAGVFVPKSTVDAAVGYIKACQLPDGGFCYIRNETHLGSAFARSAAAVVGLFSAGIYDGENIDRGLKYLTRFIPNQRGVRDFFTERYFYYAHYYAALAMWTAGGNHWTEWFPAIRDELLTRFRLGNQGSWTDPGHGAAYATAMACIVLQLPNNYLPILQK
ncbi:prenyltransferase/squalene oxidase repeat-containing protein [Limnoglobus roseus]|uniref:Prenyltransferase n=1 Tax=Limnoglobus roseus TaxID=2598579 RepID=A0A5C1AD70_9BACT|nr:prenyltransferase/squalene oxidase repeat-containing protein [Limnoglobus roseus]QEL15054.1 prenyltransferase [Limnoglobus roseus]